ncbi:MAG: zeta toxin family protein [bacterium]
MIGDKIIISEYHHEAARMVLEQLRIMDMELPYSIAVSGESGSGKSEIAEVLRLQMDEMGYKVMVLGQDDYFRLPPHSNHKQRKIDIQWVGPQEVQMELMNEHVQKLCSKRKRRVIKPLVHFSEDIIGTETVSGPFDIVIAEGTYTSLLKDVTVRVFIDANFRETRFHRLSRKRDQSLENDRDQELNFLETVLQIEHDIISRHKNLAQIVIPSEKVLMRIHEKRNLQSS